MLGAVAAVLPSDGSALAIGELWVARYDRGGGPDQVEAMAMSPDGSRVFVTGLSSEDLVIVAYDAATGARISGQGRPTI